VTAADLDRLVRREFPPEQVEEACAVLARYGSGPGEREPDRVRIAVLKLAGGDLERLEHFAGVAAVDYRDVLAFAEYPAYFDKVLGPEDEAERRELVDDDWRQYKDWFEK
jgi:hypothetical protein